MKDGRDNKNTGKEKSQLWTPIIKNKSSEPYC